MTASTKPTTSTNKLRHKKTLADLPYPLVEHPELEVHSFHSLSRVIGCSPTGLDFMFRTGRCQFVAFNHQRMRNVFAITKAEVARLITLVNERAANAQIAKDVLAEQRKRGQARKEAAEANRKAREERKKNREFWNRFKGEIKPQ